MSLHFALSTMPYNCNAWSVPEGTLHFQAPIMQTSRTIFVSGRLLPRCKSWQNLARSALCASFSRRFPISLLLTYTLPISNLQVHPVIERDIYITHVIREVKHVNRKRVDSDRVTGLHVAEPISIDECWNNVFSLLKTSEVTLLQVQESLQHNQAVQQQQQQQLNHSVQQQQQQQQQQHNQAVQQQQHNQAVQQQQQHNQAVQQQQQSILQCLPNRLEQQLNVPSADMQVQLCCLLCR